MKWSNLTYMYLNYLISYIFSLFSSQKYCVTRIQFKHLIISSLFEWSNITWGKKPDLRKKSFPIILLPKLWRLTLKEYLCSSFTSKRNGWYKKNFSEKLYDTANFICIWVQEKIWHSSFLSYVHINDPLKRKKLNNNLSFLDHLR